ncbi:MtnX-like HAD-IB family phosphatase [Paenibacillus lutrae]|uniref:phosphoserine phosphatase n=1 Tax=Paenibacillus lutrae TaxID=2078573 RepID=A0A7X3FL88_9BACL|nr:MtnX-like HAD-IB family phosphatase [Paenibacillus lutrae]MVP01801.1 HAD-IB family phosphatase [Paenibacillus lutrae]
MDKKQGQLVVVTDFDGTLMHEDVGAMLMQELGVEEKPETKEMLAKFLNKEIGSREWIHESYGQLGGRQEEVNAIADRVSLREGAEKFLDFCKSGGIPVTILSDGMEYYIHRILKRFGVEVDRIIANPIQYDKQGNYMLQVQNKNGACSWCGCCKAGVVRSLKAQGYRVIYIGDGSSDIYGSGFADWVFARSSLARYLEQEQIPFYPFATFHDVMDVLEPQLEQFHNGQAGRRSEIPHAFCKFAAE